VRSGEIQKPL